MIAALLTRKDLNAYGLTITQVLTVAFAASIPVANFLTTSIYLVLVIACVFQMDRNTWSAVIKHPITIAIMIFIGLHIAAIYYSIANQAEILQSLRKSVRLLYFPLLLPIFMHAKWRHYAICAFCATLFFTVLVSLFAGELIFKDSIFTSLFVVFAIFSLAHYSVDYAKYRWLSIPLVLFFTYYLLCIGTGRVGQILFMFLFVLFSWQRFAHTLKQQLGAIAVLACIIATMLFMPSSFAHRQIVAIGEIKQYVPTEEDDSSHYSSMGLRLMFFNNTWHLIKLKPFLGWGTGAFKEAYAKYAPQVYSKDIVVSNPHNQYLLTWVQMGIPGLLSLLYLFYTFIRSFVSYKKLEGFLGVGLLCAVMLGCMVNSWLLDYSSMFFFVFFAAVFAGAKLESHNVCLRGGARPLMTQEFPSTISKTY